MQFTYRKQRECCSNNFMIALICIAILCDWLNLMPLPKTKTKTKTNCDLFTSIFSCLVPAIHVFATSSDRFTGLPGSVLNGESDNFHWLWFYKACLQRLKWLIKIIKGIFLPSK